MTSVQRYDTGSPITRSETTPEGYLKVWSRTARTGVQVYHKADGSTVREYRPPEEVASPEALASFQMKVVTWGHPPVLLDATNTKEYQIGHNGSESYFNGNFVEVPHIITDAESIKRILNKEAVEVSPGYKVEADPTPGISPEGERYDVVQRNIRINHVAVVPKGRSGPEVRLLLDRMDSQGAVACEQDNDPVAPVVPAKNSMATVNLDGLTLELPAEAAGPVQSYIQTMTQKLKTATDRADELQTTNGELNDALVTAVAEKDTAEGRADALELALSELPEGGEERTDSEEDGRFYVTLEELDGLLVERLQLLQHLAPVMEEDFKFDSVDPDSAYITAFGNIFGEEPDDEMTMDYVRGMVDAHIISGRTDSEDETSGRNDAASARTDSTSTLRSQLQNRKPAPANNGAEQARAARLDRWKEPMTTSKD